MIKNSWWIVGIGAATVLALVITAPFWIKENQSAQILFGIIMSALSTGIGVFATRKYAEMSRRDELTRYGLQAWRNIDSLGIKIATQMQAGSADIEILEQWALDIDQARLAWQDLLREVFDLQARLQLETEEVAAKYKKRIALAENDQSKAELEDEKKLEIARLKNQAPLPLSSNESVNCPECNEVATVSLGAASNASRWPICQKCGCKYPVHRASDGSATVNADGRKPLTGVKCPSCGHEHSWNVTAEHQVRFIRECSGCGVKIRFEGTSSSPQVTAA